MVFICAQTTPSLCFGLIFVRGNLNPANSSELKFRKYSPQAPPRVLLWIYSWMKRFQYLYVCFPFQLSQLSRSIVNLSL